MCMKVEKIIRKSGWEYVRAAALATMGKTFDGKLPQQEWVRKMAMSPHSPMRELEYFIQFRCPYFVAMHLVRHHEGVSWYVSSQRNDRQSNYDRNAARQDTEVLVTCSINGDALKFISRRRLCNKADESTRKMWSMIRDAIDKIDPDMAWAMRPECAWCGGKCPEMRGCGMCKPLMEVFG